MPVQERQGLSQYPILVPHDVETSMPVPPLHYCSRHLEQHWAFGVGRVDLDEGAGRRSCCAFVYEFVGLTGVIYTRSIQNCIVGCKIKQGQWSDRSALKLGLSEGRKACAIPLGVGVGDIGIT